MDTITQPPNHEISSRCLQSHDSGQPVASQGPEHGQKLGRSLPLRSSPATAQTKGARPRLEDRSGGDGIVPRPARSFAANAHGMDPLGGRPVAACLPVAGKVQPVLKRRRRAGAVEGTVNPIAVLRLLEAQGYRCALTGWPLDPETASLDHIFAICRGGEHRIENTQVVHRTVNRAKGTLTNDEFISMCAQVVRHRGEAGSQLTGPNPQTLPETSHED
jgi:hypothetical protein